MGFPLYGGAVINTYMLKKFPMTAARPGDLRLKPLCGYSLILVAASMLNGAFAKTFGIGSAMIFVGALWLAMIASRPWHIGGFECSPRRESVSAPSFLQLRRHALVQPLSWKDHAVTLSLLDSRALSLHRRSTES